jgi:hypothetical protein
MPTPKQRLKSINDTRDFLTRLAAYDGYSDEVLSELAIKAKALLNDFPELGLLDEIKLDPHAYGMGFGEK